jgi:uncharacterized protein (TIGR03067 family)
MRRCLGVLVVAVLPLGFAPAPLPKPDPTKADLKALQGGWVIVSRTFEGRPVAHVITRVEIRDDGCTYLDAAGTFRSTWALNLDARLSPRCFDQKFVDGVGFPANVGPFSACGVYALEEDRLTMCYVQDNKKRPTDLDGSKPGCWLDVLKREKPKR